MMRSEQLDTKLWLAADLQVSRGLLLQKLPDTGGTISSDTDADAWNRAVTLASTLSNDEMLSTDIMTLMQRLYWEETIRVFEPLRPSFSCNCSRERVGNMLKLLGQEEVDDALNDLGKLEINCDFCGRHYSFDKVDCAQLFATHTLSDAVQPPGSQQH